MIVIVKLHSRFHLTSTEEQVTPGGKVNRRRSIGAEDDRASRIG